MTKKEINNILQNEVDLRFNFSKKYKSEYVEKLIDKIKAIKEIYKKQKNNKNKLYDLQFFVAANYYKYDIELYISFKDKWCVYFLYKDKFDKYDMKDVLNNIIINLKDYINSLKSNKSNGNLIKN